MIYLASPYSHPSKLVRAERAAKVGEFAASCAKAGLLIYSPIASWHHLAVKHDMPSDAVFWQKLDFSILRHASELWLFQLDGWKDSQGMAGEKHLAERLDITVRNFDGNTFLEVT